MEDPPPRVHEVEPSSKDGLATTCEGVAVQAEFVAMAKVADATVVLDAFVVAVVGATVVVVEVPVAFEEMAFTVEVAEVAVLDFLVVAVEVEEVQVPKAD
jgi:hypothetical protein